MIDKYLRASLDQGWVITIMYQQDEEITKRDIRVLSIGSDKIKAYCYLRQQPRFFRRDRILAADWCRERYG